MAMDKEFTCEDGSHTRGGMAEKGQVDYHLAINTKIICH